MFWLLSVIVIFLVDSPNIAFITLKLVSSILNALRNLMTKRCRILPNGCPTWIQAITWVSSFILLTWSTMVMGLHIEPLLCARE